MKQALADDVKFCTLKTVQVDTNRGEGTLTGRAHRKQEKQHAGVPTRKVVEIEPANPRVIYVPTYNPAVITGPGGILPTLPTLITPITLTTLTTPITPG
jgi:hypothetical protein